MGKAQAQEKEQTVDCQEILALHRLGTGLLPQKNAPRRETKSFPILPSNMQRTPKSSALRKSLPKQIRSMRGGMVIMKSVMVRKC